MLLAPDHTTGQLITGIPGRLCFKIVGFAVNNDRMAKNIPDPKAVCNKRAPCAAVVCKERRQVARMGRVRTVFRIIMGFCICKRVLRISGAAAALVDVHGKDVFGTFC